MSNNSISADSLSIINAFKARREGFGLLIETSRAIEIFEEKDGLLHYSEILESTSHSLDLGVACLESIQKELQALSPGDYCTSKGHFQEYLMNIYFRYPGGDCLHWFIRPSLAFENAKVHAFLNTIENLTNCSELIKEFHGEFGFPINLREDKCNISLRLSREYRASSLTLRMNHYASDYSEQILYFQNGYIDGKLEFVISRHAIFDFLSRLGFDDKSTSRIDAPGNISNWGAVYKLYFNSADHKFKYFFISDANKPKNGVQTNFNKKFSDLLRLLRKPPAKYIAYEYTSAKGLL